VSVEVKYESASPSKRNRVRPFRNYWGTLRQFKAPCALVESDRLILEPKEIAALMTLLESVSRKSELSGDGTATVRISQKTLMERTGYSKNLVVQALRQLKDKKFIRRRDAERKKFGEFAVREYTICDSKTGEPLYPSSGRTLYYSDRLPYFTVPKCLVTENQKHWGMAHLSGSELALYTAVLYQANVERNNRFEFQSAELRALSGLSRQTFENAVDALEIKGLIRVIDYEILLTDPYTAEPLHEQTGNDEDDPANYWVGSKRLDMNWEEVERTKKLIEEAFRAHTLHPQRNGDYHTCCIFHQEKYPSLSISPTKRCFHCLACARSGNLTELLMAVSGRSKGGVFLQMAQIAGDEVEYRQPDKNALAIYSYRDMKGKLIKQVLRYPDFIDEATQSRKKNFAQRRPAGGGSWIWNTDGVEPLLYNLPQLQFVQSVWVCEGEKDAKTVTDLHLRDARGGDIVGTTSGGSGSWHDELADSLRDKNVLILPDNDAAGKKYAQSIGESLSKREIGFRMISFEGTGCKDVTEYVEAYSAEKLKEFIGAECFYYEPQEPVVPE
jgi:DNA-binding MarR family transcriptional regulator/5S rRNA maturation endonuclease (ribonuclease M5)